MSSTATRSSSASPPSAWNAPLPSKRRRAVAGLMSSGRRTRSRWARGLGTEYSVLLLTCQYSVLSTEYSESHKSHIELAVVADDLRADGDVAQGIVAIVC